MIGKQLRFYTDVSSLTERNIKNLTPLLSYHWAGLGLDEIRCNSYNPESPIVLTDSPADADWVALPMYWSYYLWNDKANMPEAFEIADEADKYAKPLIIWFKGDLVPVIPFKNSILFLPGIVRTKMMPGYRACPVFVEDPEPIYGREEIRFRKKTEKPLVGFCGFGSMSMTKLGWSIAYGLYLNAVKRIRKSNYDEIPIVPATRIRNRAMKYLERHSGIDTCFTVRSSYTSKHALHDANESSRIFYGNIYGTDYTLCVRGFGNWSYRFYETLACGRIPVFVDTDCVLPLESRIDWRRYCVWVDSSELHLIGEKVLDFHSALSQADFIELQSECRKLWRDHLTIHGCMDNIQNYLE